MCIYMYTQYIYMFICSCYWLSIINTWEDHFQNIYSFRTLSFLDEEHFLGLADIARIS